MATYYVRPDGSDTNTGTGPSPSQAWQTLSKAFQTVVSGDTVYVAPGVYGNANLSFTNTFTTTVTIEGDIYGQYFTDLPGGWPIVTNYASLAGAQVNDGTPVISLDGRPNVTLRRLVIIGGYSPACIFLGYGTIAANLVVEECVIFKQGTNEAAIRGGIVGPTSSLTLRRVSIFALTSTPFSLAWDSTAGNYTLNLTLESCFVWAHGWTNAFSISKNGSGTGKAGGGLINGCTLISGNENAVYLGGTGYSTTTPFRVVNSIIVATNNVINSGTTGGLVEDYNVIVLLPGNTARVNVAAGANTIVVPSQSYPLAFAWVDPFQIGQWPFMMPWPGTNLQGMTLSADAPATDLFGRPRNTRGAISVAMTGVASSSANADSGTGRAVELTGRTCHDLLIPVDAVSTTISVKVKWDANHGDTNPPQAQLLPAPELGYSGQTITATAPGTNYQTLTFTAFTPTKKGIVVLRLISRAAAANGKAWFDTVTVS